LLYSNPLPVVGNTFFEDTVVGKMKAICLGRGSEVLRLGDLDADEEDSAKIMS